MNTITNEFKKVCENTTPQFDAIVNAIHLPKKVDTSKVTRLLSYIDTIIDYYIKSVPQQGIRRYPIVFIPCAKDWAEEVCIEYVAYKLEILFDSDRINELKEQLVDRVWVVPNDLTKKQCTQERKWRTNIKKLIKTRNCNNRIRNLIVCGQSVFGNIKRNTSLQQFLGDSAKTSITQSNVIDTEKEYADYQNFENIFCFYSNNGICDDYEPNSLYNWHGLQNCFIFKFDSSPYCLDNVLKWGKKLCDKFPHSYLLSKDENQRKYQHFIALTQDEAHYIFNEASQNAHKIIPYPAEIENEKEYIADFYRGDDEWRFSIKDRNILSLCLSQGTLNKYLDYLKKEKPTLFENDWWQTILVTITSHFPMKEIVSQILSYVQPETKAALILCDTPDTIKNDLKVYFRNQGLTIKYYQYKDLKDKKINESKIVILRFCPHNLSSKNYPHKNPNSFDEYSLKKGQTILDIINELTILDYLKYKYDYDLYLCLATSSQYRRDKLGGDLSTPQKPIIQYISHYSELDDDTNETPQNTIPTVKFEFADGTNRSLPENEVLICKNKGGEQFIENIRNLNEFGQLDKIEAIQPINELADTTIDVFYEDARNTTTVIENTWRDELVNQGLIPQRHLREVPIWKFLLERKIRNYCINNQLIDSNQNEPLWQLLRQKMNNEHLQNLHSILGVKVQLERVIRDWCDVTKVEPIIPGFKKDRENLMIKYMGLNKGEISLYRKKQLLTRNMTRTRNSVTESFLCKILFDDITDGLAEELLSDTQYTEYIAIENKGDIETLKTIAEERINLKTIKTYSL